MKKVLLRKIFNFILKKDTMYLRISIQSNECQDILVKSIDILEREKTISLGTEAKRTNDSYRQGKIQK